MKSYPDPSKVPQTEAHPEPFPEVTTLPKGWDLSGLLAAPGTETQPIDTAHQTLPILMDARMVVEEDLQ